MFRYNNKRFCIGSEEIPLLANCSSELMKAVCTEVSKTLNYGVNLGEKFDMTKTIFSECQ